MNSDDKVFLAFTRIRQAKIDEEKGKLIFSFLNHLRKSGLLLVDVTGSFPESHRLYSLVQSFLIEEKGKNGHKPSKK
jgi:hypothetical protein